MSLTTVTTSQSATNGVTCSCGTSAYNASFTTLRAAGTHAEVNGVLVNIRPSTGGIFSIQLYQGPSDTLIGTLHLTAPNASKQLQMLLPLKIPADVQVRAKAGSDGAGRSLYISMVGYTTNPFKHTLPTTFTTYSACDFATTFGYSQFDAGNGTMTESVISASLSAAIGCVVIYGRDNDTGGSSSVTIEVRKNGTEVSGQIQQVMTNGDSAYFSTPPNFTGWSAGDSLSIAAASGSATYNTIRYVAYGFDTTPESSGGGSTTIINGGGVQRMLKDGETNAGRKTIPLEIKTSAGAIYNANGETCRIKIGTGAWGNATNTIVGTADGNEITLTDAEAASASPGDLIQVYCDDTVNHLASPISVFEVGAFDPTASTVDANMVSILGTAGATTELSAVPAVNASFWDMLKWMFYKSRNKITQTSSAQVVYKDDGSTTLATSTTSDNGTTATRGEFS